MPWTVISGGVEEKRCTLTRYWYSSWSKQCSGRERSTSGANAESGTSVMDRVAHPAKVHVESCHASNQVVVDETPEAQQFSKDCLGFALSASVFGPVSLRCRRDAQPYVYEQTRKRKARRNDSLTFYLSSSVRRSRLAAAPPLPPPLRRGSRAHTAATPPDSHRRTRQNKQENACGGHVYQARRTHHAAHEEGPAKGAIALPVLRASERLLQRALPAQRVNIRGQALRYLPFVMTNKEVTDGLMQDRQTTGEIPTHEL